MTALASGFLFGLGLALSGMTSPVKVYGFLDFLGSWDPTLAFVMGGAVLTHGLGLHLVQKDGRTLCRTDPAPQGARLFERRLLIGAVFFGLGWGLGGYCPGPALVSAGSAGRQPLFFLAGLAVGLMAVPAGAKDGPDCG